MPGQGSPKTLLDAVNVHEFTKWHVAATIEYEFAALQLKSCMAGLGQSCSPGRKRPYLAS